MSSQGVLAQAVLDCDWHIKDGPEDGVLLCGKNVRQMTAVLLIPHRSHAHRGEMQYVKDNDEYLRSPYVPNTLVNLNQAFDMVEELTQHCREWSGCGSTSLVWNHNTHTSGV